MRVKLNSGVAVNKGTKPGFPYEVKLVENKVIRMKVYRSPSPDRTDESVEGEHKEYEIPFEERMTVMNVLDIIQEKYDRSLAFYKSCRTGRCSGCLVAVDGKTQFACSTLAKNGMKIGPAKKSRVVRDLIVELPGESIRDTSK